MIFIEQANRDEMRLQQTTEGICITCIVGEAVFFFDVGLYSSLMSSAFTSPIDWMSALEPVTRRTSVGSSTDLDCFTVQEKGCLVITKAAMGLTGFPFCTVQRLVSKILATTSITISKAGNQRVL